MVAGYPRQYESVLALKNGREIFIRPIRPEDKALLLDLFNRISEQSLYLRFLRHLPSLPDNLLHHFTHVDYHEAFALVALLQEHGCDAAIAVCRYALDKESGMTDLAIAVRDDWQQLGLGMALLQKILEIGRKNGITCFRSIMDPTNDIMKRVLTRMDCEVKFSLQNGYYHIEINI